ncbi:winged helix-turn-helix domain-containing protein [Aliidiomarina sp. Khilg15.8]
MDSPTKPPISYVFCGWHFEPAKQTLTRGTQALSLERRLARLLELFCQHPNEVLRKDFLLEKLWAPRVVSEDSLAVAVSQLRKLLATGEDTQYIRTVSGQGYMWVVDVREEHSREKTFKPPMAYALALPVVVAFLLALWWWLSPTSTEVPRDEPTALHAQAQRKLESQQLREAVVLYRQLIAADPADACAYLGLAEAKMEQLTPGQLQDHAPELRALLNKSLELDPQLLRAKWLLGQVYFYGDWNVQKSAAVFTEAYEEGLRDATFILNATEVYLAAADFNRAATLIRTLRRLHPERFATPSVAWMHLMRGDPDEAAAEIQRILATEALSPAYHMSAQHIAYQRGDHAQAWQHLYALMQHAGMPEHERAEVEALFTDSGLAAVHRCFLEHQVTYRLGHYAPPLAWARYALVAGDEPAALRYLEQAWQERQPEMLWLAIDPHYQAVLQHPRVADMIGYLRRD